jgi:hypothetical protein
VADSVYRVKYTVRTTQTDQSKVPNLRLLTEVVGSGVLAASAGGRVGAGPFAPETTPKTYNMYVDPPDLSSASPAVTNLKVKYEVIDFSGDEEGTNYLDQVVVERFPRMDKSAGTQVADIGVSSGWSGIALGSPFGAATVSSNATGIYIETPATVSAPVAGMIDYGLWTLPAGGGAGAYVTDKLYRFVFKMQSPDQSTIGKVRVMAQNAAGNWVGKMHIVPDQVQSHMPDNDGEEYSVWQEGIPVLYGDSNDNITLLYDVADGSDTQEGRVYLTGVEIYTYDIP